MLIRSLLFVAAVSISASAFAQTCVGPVCDPIPSAEEPTGPTELCLPDGCQLVTYQWLGSMVVAESALSNGYALLGWAGPCLASTHGECPDIRNQAFYDLYLNALRANRAQGF